MQRESYDAIVIGLGAMGSSAAYQLASRGARVLGLEQFTPAHELGSSGGLTRIIRLAYFEHPDYVPLLRAAWELWPQIELEAGVAAGQMMQVTGGLYSGRRGSAVLDGSLRSAQEHGLAHELLDADESRHRFPALQLDDDMQTLHEPLAGILFAPRCISGHLRLAERNGADLRFGERMTGWTSDGDGLTVTTDKGSYSTAKLVVAAGAWLPRVAPELELPLTVERNALFWYRAGSAARALRRRPAAGLDHGARRRSRLLWLPDGARDRRLAGAGCQGRAAPWRPARPTPNPSTARRLTPTRPRCVTSCAATCRSPTGSGSTRACACTRTRPTSTSCSISIPPTTAS